MAGSSIDRSRSGHSISLTFRCGAVSCIWLRCSIGHRAGYWPGNSPTALTADFCVEALESAKRRYGTPEIVNTDQGSQFTSEEFVSAVLGCGAQLRMDGRGAWSDKLFIERFWRTVKYEEVYLRAYDNVSDARRHLERYMAFYNSRRGHSSLRERTPDTVYFHQTAMAA